MGASTLLTAAQMHVLLVEDDAVLADGLSRILESHGMQVEVLGNGTLADQVLQRSDAAVAVLDIGLPGIGKSVV